MWNLISRLNISTKQSVDRISPPVDGRVNWRNNCPKAQVCSSITSKISTYAFCSSLFFYSMLRFQYVWSITSAISWLPTSGTDYHHFSWLYLVVSGVLTSTPHLLLSVYNHINYITQGALVSSSFCFILESCGHSWENKRSIILK